jgi:hypothetical protein
MADLAERMQAYQDKHQKFSARLSEIGFIWPGNIQWRYLTCGKPNCTCKKDPEARHGPYAYWTSKKANKTVSSLLSPEEADLLEEWIENRRKLEAIIREMKKLSQKIFEVALKLKKEQQTS